MPLLTGESSSGTEEIASLSQSDISSVLDEWNSNFYSFKFQDVSDIRKDASNHFYIVLKSPMESGMPTFHLYDWILNKGGVSLNCITALQYRHDHQPTEIVEAPKEPEPAPASVAAQEPEPLSEPAPVISAPVVPSVPVSLPAPVSVEPQSAYFDDDDEDAGTSFLDDSYNVSKPTMNKWALTDSEGLQVEIYEGIVLPVGRSKIRARLRIDNPSVSRVHAELSVESGILYVRDLGSRNGTKLNGAKIDAFRKYPLKQGDEVTFSVKTFIVGNSREA